MIIKQEKHNIQAIDYLKEKLIYKMENIKEFEAYFEDTDPYYEVNEDGYKKYYKLIIRDEGGNEFWLDSNCGYPGSGPSQTEKILQLLGIREDFKITERRSIKETNLIPDHSLNLLVCTDIQVGDHKNFLFMGCADFNYPYQRLNAINLLNKFGYTIRLIKDDYRVRDYFVAYKEDNSFGEYNINNTYVINTNLKDTFNSKDLKTIISAIIMNTGGTIEFEEV